MAVRDIYSNFAIHSELQDGYAIGSDDTDYWSILMNLDGGSGFVGFVPLGTTSFEVAPIVGTWSITKLQILYFNNDSWSGTPIVEVFDPVTGVSEYGNRMVYADGSPVVLPIEGDETSLIDVMVIVNNPICSTGDPDTSEYTYIALDADAGTFSNASITVNYNCMFYRGRAEFVEPGRGLTFFENWI